MTNEEIKEAQEASKEHRKRLDNLEEIARPLLKYLCENYHPHVKVIITGTSIEVLEGIGSIPNINDYIVD